MEQLSDGAGSILWIGAGVLLLGGALLILLRSRANTGDRPAAPAQPSARVVLSADSLAKVRRILAAGNKIQAIKEVRDQTGLGLKEAKDYVDALERAPHTHVPIKPDAPPSATADIDADPEVIAQLSRGNKIAAIQRVRELSGLGLRDAKDLVDALERTFQANGRPAATHIAATDATADPEVRALVAQGNKIQAIKRVRELTGLGLKEAKDLVDGM